MPNRIDYRFRTLVNADSQDAVLIKYLRSPDPEFTEKEMILWASSAYWLPLALREQGSCSVQQLKQSARTSIYKLRQHINYLAQTFGLEGEVAAIPIELPLPQANSSCSKPVDETALSLSSSEVPNQLPLKDKADPEITSTDFEMPDLLHHQDDEAFQTLFGS
jgi:hypothetical protein